MGQLLVLCFVLIFNTVVSKRLGIFHENTKVTFRADQFANYFGYSVLLNDTGLFVGAPKARSRIIKSISTGLVFSCPTDVTRGTVTCTPLNIDVSQTSFSGWSSSKDIANTIKDDMWFGAVISLFPSGELLICAPRWSYYMFVHRDEVPNGACYIYGKTRGEWFFPMWDIDRGPYYVDGRPANAKKYGSMAYDMGQAGLSAKVTEDNTLIIGMPGVIIWTGAICEYKFSYPDTGQHSVKLNYSSITTRYRSADIDFLIDYIGYSIESGIFDSSGKTLYVVGAPRSRSGYGQVLIFDKLLVNRKATVSGPHLGSYFGASLLCADVNGDGVVDLLVGAPTYAKEDGLNYDQGAVYVYLTKRTENEFILEEAGYVIGSGISGSRFGTAIADLGDVDGDGYRDIAIGAPWEDGGKGSVYIYRGSPTGLRSSYQQKVVVADARGFGISISKGLDVDGNNCNDLAVGAYESGAAYIFLCIPTLQVLAQNIEVPDVMDLPQNATNFTVSFCVTSSARKMWPNIKIDLTAKVIVDGMLNRAHVFKKSEYNISLVQGGKICQKITIMVTPHADMSRPIPIGLKLTPVELMTDNSTIFLNTATRLCDESVLERNVDVQLTKGCGEDLICTPLLTMKLEPLTDPYIPGSDQKLGFSINISNAEEPAYGAKVRFTLQSDPKRLPSDCTLNGLNVTCKVPSPLYKDESVQWDIELESTLKYTIDKEVKIVAILEDSLNKNNENVKELNITVTPVVNITISGKVLPNKTIAVTRDMWNRGDSVNFTHYFQLTNYGPSDMYSLSGALDIADKVHITREVKGCLSDSNGTECHWSLPTNVSLPVNLPLQLNLRLHKNYLEENTPLEIVSTIKLFIDDKNQSFSLTTIVVLEAGPSVWPLIGASVAGIILLAAIVFGMYKYGFFSRTKRDELKKLKEQNEDDEASPNPSNVSTDNSLIEKCN